MLLFLWDIALITVGKILFSDRIVFASRNEVYREDLL